MSTALAGWLQVLLLIAALAACYVPLGNYIAHIFTSEKHWRVEAGIYKIIGVNPEADQKWSAYLRSMLAFSAVSVLFLYGLERLQHYLLLSLGMANVPPALAFNTAASFVTNTNWQNYSGESTMGYLVQMAGLAVQNFLSAAVGLVIAIALIRGFIRSRTSHAGQLLGGRHPGRHPAAAAAGRGGRPDPGGQRGNRQLRRLPHGDHPVRRAPDHRGRPGGLPGGHQGPGQQRRRLLQRQLLAPVREPEPVHQPVRDLPAAAHPVQHARARSARWSRTTSRATCCSRSWPSSG